MGSIPQSADFYKTDSPNYDIYRPQYPQILIDKIAEFGKGKKAYLDLCTGPGTLFFKLFRNLSEIAVGIDGSEDQIKVASSRLADLKEKESDLPNRVEIIKGDVYGLVEELKARGISTKFDLITIGTALHYFDIAKLFPYITDHLLAPEGKLFILFYRPDHLAYNIKDREYAKKAQQHYNNFNILTFPYFKGKLTKYYEDFSKYFKKVVKESIIVDDYLSIEDYLRRLRTYSHYQFFLIEAPRGENWEDPIETHRRYLENDLKEYTEEFGEKYPEPPLLMKVPVHYFECSNI